MNKEDVVSLLRSNIIKLKSYKSARSIFKKPVADKKIYLDANENPYKPYTQDGDATDLNRYPEPQPIELKKRLSDIYQVDSEKILITRGSGEAIDILIRAFCEPNRDSIIVCPPTFSLYKVYAEINSVKIFKIPLLQDKGFQLDVDTIVGVANREEVKIIFIPSPNAPMGHMMRREDILLLCKKLSSKAAIVVDEAYIEFSARHSMAHLIDIYPNLIILRTLSKDYAMAGLRIGACIALPALVAVFRAILAPYPLSVLSIKSAVKALQPPGIGLAKKHINLIVSEREWLSKELRRLSIVKEVFPSLANFLLFRVDESKAVVKFCYKKDVVVRSQELQLAGAIRVSIGTYVENRAFLDVLRNFNISRFPRLRE